MRYLFIDISLAKNKVVHLLGMGPVSTDNYYNRLLDQLNKYESQMDKSSVFDNTEINRIARNFDCFIKRHQIYKSN